MAMLQDLQRTISRFVGARRKRRQLRRELEQLEAMGSLDAVLADIGLVRSQFEPLIASDTTDLLGQMQARLGIDPARLCVETRREMEWTCAQCTDKRRCRQWLSETDATGFDFCPNARYLGDALARQRPAHA